ncbi:hypothetical protein TcWFU_001015 [Taenia crassiceps]|uniref:Uncharacterized protein n=1 Tax=Taenia crassiceps TaxID=6207 RepID=A0ABR4QG64_9CEST
MDSLVELVLKALGYYVLTGIVFLVCIVGIGVVLLMVYKGYCILKTATFARPGNSKRKKKMARRRRQEEVDSSNRPTSSPVPPQETVDDGRGLVEATSLEQITTAAEDGNEEGGGDSNVGTNVNPPEDVSGGETPDSEPQMNHPVVELYPKSKTLKKKEREKHKSSGHSVGHSSHHHAQSVIDSDRLAMILELENEANATKMEYKQQLVQLRLARGEESALNKDLYECQVQDARLKREIPDAAVQYERAMGFVGRKAGQIGGLKERFEREKLSVERKDMELRRLCDAISLTLKDILNCQQDVIPYPGDPVAQLDAIGRAVSAMMRERTCKTIENGGEVQQ